MVLTGILVRFSLGHILLAVIGANDLAYRVVVHACHLAYLPSFHFQNIFTISNLDALSIWYFGILSFLIRIIIIFLILSHFVTTYVICRTLIFIFELTVIFILLLFQQVAILQIVCWIMFDLALLVLGKLYFEKLSWTRLCWLSYHAMRSLRLYFFFTCSLLFDIFIYTISTTFHVIN